MRRRIPLSCTKLKQLEFAEQGVLNHNHGTTEILKEANSLSTIDAKERKNYT